jgi:hypothetical protein
MMFCSLVYIKSCVLERLVSAVKRTLSKMEVNTHAGRKHEETEVGVRDFST